MRVVVASVVLITVWCAGAYWAVHAKRDAPRPAPTHYTAHKTTMAMAQPFGRATARSHGWLPPSPGTFHTPNDPDSRTLERFITDSTPSAALAGRAQKVLSDAWYVWLWYESPEAKPGDVPRWEVSRRVLLEALFEKEGVDHSWSSSSRDSQRYERLAVGLGPMLGSVPTVTNPLRTAREPLRHGYTLVSVDAHPLPGAEARQRTLHVWEEGLSRFVADLRALSDRYPQLRLLDERDLRPGRGYGGQAWPGWPEFPGLYYQYGLEHAYVSGMGTYERASPHWCKISLSLAPVHGGSSSGSLARAHFHRQAVEVGAFVRAHNNDGAFLGEVAKAIQSLLQSLGEEEERLGGIPQVPAFPWPLSGSSVRAEDTR